MEYVKYIQKKFSKSNTVKTVKGLEFKEVFVLTRGMTNNEKYISYTRALAKLNVINYLPIMFERDTSILVSDEQKKANKKV